MYSLHAVCRRLTIRRPESYSPRVRGACTVEARMARPGGGQTMTWRSTIGPSVRVSEERLRQALRASNTGIIDHDLRTGAVYCSPELRQIYGWRLEQTITIASFLDRAHPDDREALSQAIARAHDPGGDGVFDLDHRIVRESGEVRWLTTRAQTFFEVVDDARRPVRTIGALTDITERNHSERALRESEELLSTIFNSTSESQVLYRVDAGNRLYMVAANRAVKEASAALFPDGGRQFIGLYRDEFLAGQGFSPEQIEMEMPAFLQAIASGQPRAQEIEIPTPAHGVSVLETRIEPILDGSRRCTHVLWVGRDVTERRRAADAERRLNEELEQRVAERTSQLEAANTELEAFAYSVSHDLRAPARAVDGYAGILMEDYGARLDAEGQRLCAVVRSEAQRMGRLIDDLLAFSRLGRAEMRTSRVDMGRLVAEVFEELAPPDRRARIALRVCPLPDVTGDPALLRQVWLNLLGNAIKFSGLKPQAVIEVSGRRDGGEVVYAIADNGAGFDMAYQAKLFGVFQRLHDDSDFSGTGVGLAIVQRVIQRHGGRVWAEGMVDRGATFFVALPLEDGSA